MVERQETAGDEDRLEGALGVGSIGAGGGVGRRRLGAEQLAEVVGQDLGGEILLKGEIGEPAGRLKAQTACKPEIRFKEFFWNITLTKRRMRI